MDLPASVFDLREETLSFLGDLCYFAAMLQDPVYLDYNATTPVHPLIKQKVLEWLEISGNPSSIHSHGRDAKKILRESRKSVADAIGALPMEIIFTSGGSEANNMAIKGLLQLPIAQERREIIVSPVEHPCVLECMEEAHRLGFVIHYLKINSLGQIDFDHYQSLLSDKTLLVSVMLANNETGHIFPIQKISSLAKAVGAFVHSDCVQALGRIPVRVSDLGVDFASFSGHKVYALKGIGALYSRRGSVALPNLIHGGGQERGRRAGTENTLAMASMGEILKVSSTFETKPIEDLRDYFEQRVSREIPHVICVGAGAHRLMNTSNLIIENVHGESLLMSLDLKGFSVSTGSACSSGSQKPSHVLTALGYSFTQAQSSLRVSLGLMTTKPEVDSFIETLKTVVSHLRTIQKESTSSQESLNA